MSVVLVDLGLNNIASLVQAVEECGAAAVVSSDPADGRTAGHLILPGVGSFAAAMSILRATGWDEVLTDAAARGTPVLGICLGMQLLASRGTEGGDTLGLGLIPGTIVKIAGKPGMPVPHVGWNSVSISRREPLYAKIPQGSDFYFVHSYRFCVDNAADIFSTTSYSEEIASAVGCGSVFGVQFHPEKSSRMGMQILSNFLHIGN